MWSVAWVGSCARRRTLALRVERVLVCHGWVTLLSALLMALDWGRPPVTAKAKAEFLFLVDLTASLLLPCCARLRISRRFRFDFLLPPALQAAQRTLGPSSPGTLLLSTFALKLWMSTCVRAGALCIETMTCLFLPSHPTVPDTRPCTTAPITLML